MADQHLLTRTLSEFAATLVKGFAISDVLHDLADRVTVVLGIDSAGVSVQESGRLRFVTALDERAARLEKAQEHGQAGPCVDAWRSGKAVAVTDLSECASSWGTCPQEAREAGIVAIAGIPMRLGDKTRRINGQLQEALDSRIIIEQAKGVLAAELGISVDRAFDLMRRHARAHSASLRAVAQAVVHLGLRP